MMSRLAERLGADATEELLVGPLRGDLLGADHLAAHARVVAREQRVAALLTPLRAAPLLARLSATRGILRSAYIQLGEAAALGIDAGPAAEWLLDNYHVVQEHLQEVRANLPSSFYRELPELASGPLSGYPRVYEIAISLISHTEARVDEANVDLFVEAFQGVTPLAIGELWAVPVMLRLGLIESVRRMTLRTVQRLDELELAADWSRRILDAGDRGGADLRSVLRDFVDADEALTPHFISRLLQLLRQAEGASPALAWLEHWLADAGVSPENAVALSTQRLAMTQIMMANSITSLREIGRRDWRDFVERHSEMEALLRGDPAGVHARMTFATRDRYRHAVERIAKRSGHREASVAQWAIDLARAHLGDPRLAHVGYYLIDDGLPTLERMAGYPPTLGERLVRRCHDRPNLVLLGGIALSTALAVLAIVLLVDAPARGALWLVLLVAFFPALDVAVHALNQLLTALLPTRVLPRLDLHEHGIPEEFRTVVVVPTLFGSVDDVHAGLEHLEVQYLANREAHLHFAILSDFTDAPTECEPGDAAIVAAALDGVRALNARYAGHLGDAFLLLHRPRRWNAQQGTWMGWERKRGKLSEFNHLLRGEATDAFSVVSGDTTTLQAVRYVITLDADTVLPPDAAPSLVGALAHPLNRAVYDAERKRVVRGYGILQPRVGVALPSAHRTRFAAIASGHPGVDPYSTAVSDVYQDLYGEGSFTGKGIYDVDAFQLATHGRFPENILLSHDLIEGNYARAGLATDVIVYDDYPSRYVAFCRRKHRWIRGDWQLLPWLHRTVPGPNGPERNRLSLVSQWKIVDNLRRSTVELSQFLLLVAGWTFLPGAAWRWTLLGLGAIAAPWATALLLAAIRPPLDKSWRAYYAGVRSDAAVSAQQAALALATLPHQAWLSADAILRTLYRLFVSRRYLLSWQSASQAERSVRSVGAESWRAMRWSTAFVGLGTIALSYVALGRHFASGATTASFLSAALPVGSLVLLWLTSPWMVTRLGKTTVPRRDTLAGEERDAAIRYARLHWHFFDRFVSRDTHWLAPDNFQLDPEPVVAMRTSPTNIGLQLLATVSAHDLGFITAPDMTRRLEQTVATLATLARYRGHFYNWYDLHDLHVLAPPYISTVDSGNMAGHLIALRQACLQLATREPSLADRLQRLAEQAYDFVAAMDFTFLYDDARKLLTIGYHPDSFTPDAACYDLLASEARLASFVAIARKDVPIEHWFRLSRSLNRTGGQTALVSWSGSMFEYLMPVLVMRSLANTILEQTYHGALARHMAYARARDVPWGVSESAYNVRDHQQTYQYRAFGVPDLALQRGLGRDLVVAPYATVLGALIDPPRALGNLRALEALGALGDYGFFDALDFTRPTAGHRFALVRTHMAHHVGMSLVALTNVLLDDVWQERFHGDTMVQSAELLLHERVPRRLVLQGAQSARPDDARPALEGERPVVREVGASIATEPRVALLGSPPYTVMLNHNGSGYSRFDSLAVTRWRADGTRDDLGQYCYLKDIASARVWSSGHQPVAAPADWSRTSLALDRVAMHRRDGDLETHSEITVVPADAAEVRRVTITNTGRESHDVELTSYGEIVMATPDADRSHPSFSNLFVETEWHEWCTAITATRRPRSSDDPRLWCVHIVDAGPHRIGAVSCETDRARFLGRGRSLRNPIALEQDGPLSGTTGAVLDPIFALRTRVRVAPGQSVSVAFTTLVAESRAAAFALADRYHDSHAAQRALDLAWASTQIELRELGISPASAAAFQDLATQLLYRGGSLAPPLDELRRNRGSQPLLWTHGIPGDLPIVLATIDALDGLPTLRELFEAHRYWRRRGLAVDLVVINAQPHDYLQALRDAIGEAMVLANDAALTDVPGGVFVRRRDTMQPNEYLMLSASARMHVSCDGRTLARVLAAAEARASADGGTRASHAVASIDRRLSPPFIAQLPRVDVLASIVSALRPLVAPLIGPLPARLPRAADGGAEGAPPLPPLRFDNGIGGLDARDAYHMHVDHRHLPAAPWANVIANPAGGFIVTERGAGCTWAENAHFFRLTPWHNDPVADPISDVIYLQDADSDALWSATPAPVPHDGRYRVCHAPGRSTFDHEHGGIATELQLSTPQDDAVKLSLLRITNHSARPRRLVVTAYVEWTLGARREDAQSRVHTRFVHEQHAIFAQNHFDPHFAGWTAFLATSAPVASFTADRTSFLGRNGTLMHPAALLHDALDGVAGIALDPCGALQLTVDLAPGASREVTFLLGAAPTEDSARQVIDRLRPTGASARAAAAAGDAWTSRLGVVTVRTPDEAFNAMVNTWTLYQALACRMWARTAVYQSSGAYGFRDQLQDVLAFVYAEPAIARAHILRAAARQFVEGDVQHWWHPHTGRGVRTRFSDDLAWLPYVVERYIRVTGDATVLDAYVPWLRMRPLEPHEHEVYDLPTVTDEHGSVYEHCLRALHRACTTGSHGLPLIGTGDWNDGMSRVGAEGRGESVWLAWFLIETLRAFAPLADARGDRNEATFMRRQAVAYADAIERHGWDGHWYRRAFYDDGTPLGSSDSEECRIDSIAQSWSVISGAGTEARQVMAMEALDTQLVDESARLMPLLTPPFDRGTHDPGYIRGYLPGVRENGAQYTHAALWGVMATALRGKGDRAFELFQMLNPLTHAATAADAATYKVEPYVVAADVYTTPSQLGRGGWTWYTGSASWMYRVALETILGFTKQGDTLRLEPRVPMGWNEYGIAYRFGSATYDITVRFPGTVQRLGGEVRVDGVVAPDGIIHLQDDGLRHVVLVSPSVEPPR
ncbi:MAG: carbohydrate-binding protein [Gemmatimonadetes bacterium]|nr:carbohydrate-binding protein [Gemmatimonadota bacterium]